MCELLPESGAEINYQGGEAFVLALFAMYGCARRDLDDQILKLLEMAISRGADINV